MIPAPRHTTTTRLRRRDLLPGARSIHDARGLRRLDGPALIDAMSIELKMRADMDMKREMEYMEATAMAPAITSA